MTMYTHCERKTCVIVGAGVSGLVQAAELVRQGILKHEQILILERASDYGGVWTAANYPGAACDVFSILYQISWFKNPNWSGLFPTSQELVHYYNTFADHYGLRKCTKFRHKVIEACWSDEACVWKVVTQNLETNETTFLECSALVQAVGTYNRKKPPPVPGTADFRGDMWHTVDWPEHYDFTNKKVAYIGTGPTALQALPVVSEQAESLTIFMRSMTYCHPFSNFLYPSALLTAFARIPGLLWIYAKIVSYAFGLWTWFVFRPGTWLARMEESYCERYLYQTISAPSLREKMRPTGRFGAKRPLVSPNFFDLVQRHNVEVVKEPLTRVGIDCVVSKTSPESILQSTGSLGGQAAAEPNDNETSRKFDTIIWGTGFQMQGFGSMIPTKGRHGQLLSEWWKDTPKTLFGTMTSEFPNLFLINGPNTVAPWASIIQGIEYQAASVAHLIAWIMNERQSKPSENFWIMPKSFEEDKWTKAMDQPLERLATSTKFGPGFYYLNKDGRNTFFFPFSLNYYWWCTRRVRKGLYHRSTEKVM